MSSSVCYSSGSSTHLFKQGHIFYFRMSIPEDLRKTLGQTEYRYSLRTGYLRIARMKANKLSAVVNSCFQQLRRGSEDMGITDKQIQASVKAHLRRAIKETEENRFSTERPLTRKQLEQEEKTWHSLESDYREALATGDYVLAHDFALSICEEYGLDCTPGSLEFRKLCREILKMNVQYSRWRLRTIWGDYPELDEDIEQLFNAEVSSEPETTLDDSPLLSECLDRYVDYKISSGSWTEFNSTKNMQPILRKLIEVIGDVTVGSITKEHIRDFRDLVMKLPKHHTVSPRFRDLTLREAVLKNRDEKLDIISTKTMNSYFVKIGGFIRWMNNEGYLRESELDKVLPALKIKNKNTGSARAKITPEDLRTLFNSKPYMKVTKAHQFWIPLLGMFTGARLEELCQLHLDDIQEKEGVWVININDEGDKGVKTSSSRRLIPIHPILSEELSFLSYAESLRNAGEVRLFPELEKKKKTGKFSDSVSKWFINLLQRAGIAREDNEGRTKSFHSFRGTFTNYCKQHDIPEKKVKEIVGHEHAGDITEAYYNNSYSVSILYEDVMSKVDFGVDLSHLKEHKLFTWEK